MGRGISPQRKELIQMYFSQHPDATLKELGEFLGVSKQRAHILLNGLDIQTREQRRRQFLRESEAEILQYMANAYTSKQMAARLGVSKWSLDRRIKIIRTRLGAKSRSQVVNLARQQGLI